MEKEQMQKFYVLSPPNTYDGPFDSIEEATTFLKERCDSDYAPPENQNMVITVLNQNTNTMDLYRDNNGKIINGKEFMW